MIKTLALWIVAMIPTPQCIQQDKAKNEVQVMIVGSKDIQSVRVSGAPPVPQEKIYTYAGYNPPQVKELDSCYDVYVTKLGEGKAKLVPPPAPPKSAKH